VRTRDRAAAAVARVVNRPAAIDVGLLVVLVGSTLWLLGPPRGSVIVVGVAVIELAAVLVRHRWPVVTFAVGLLGVLAHLIVGAQPIPPDAVVLIGLFSVAADRGRRVSITVLGVGLAAAAGWNVYAFVAGRRDSVVVDVHSDGTVVPVLPGQLSPEQLQEITRQLTGPLHTSLPTLGNHSVVPPSGIRIVFDTAPLPTWGGFWLAAAVLLLVWVAGASTRRRRARLDWLRRQHETQARLAVLDERARISRELHDVVAHGLSVVVLQAQGGAAALEQRPERTRQALDAIVVTGRHALAEIRRLLHALGDDESEPWAPPPGVARLPELCERVRATGLAVELRVDGDPYEPPTAVDLAAYRIVQEALTNVLKHAGEHAATVELWYRPESLVLAVTNGLDGTPEPDPTGTGLRGMRERATLLGGTFHAGPDPEGGFVVRATLPLEGPRE